MNTVLYLNQESNMYRKTATIYKDIIRALKNNGYHTRYIIEMTSKHYNNVEVFTGGKAFSRDRLKELVTTDIRQIELTVDEYGYTTLITYTWYDDHYYIQDYISLWSVQPIEKKKV